MLKRDRWARSLKDSEGNFVERCIRSNLSISMVLIELSACLCVCVCMSVFVRVCVYVCAEKFYVDMIKNYVSNWFIIPMCVC